MANCYESITETKRKNIVWPFSHRLPNAEGELVFGKEFQTMSHLFEAVGSRQPSFSMQ